MARHAWLLGLAWAACSAQEMPVEDAGAALPDAGVLRVVAEDPFGVPLAGLTADETERFQRGDLLFERPMRPVDGLGPLYIRQKCSSCHAGDGRGPGAVRKMAAVDGDGAWIVEDASLLPYGHTERPQLAAGAMTPILAPSSGVKVSTRTGPAVVGRGYMEAILESEILAQEQAQSTRADGIHGRANRVTYHSAVAPDRGVGVWALGQRGLVGRFGLKARVVSLDDFTADAFQGDMGITSPLRPNEAANPDGLMDDEKPGEDVTLQTVTDIADYMRMLAIPPRQAGDELGRQAFTTALCVVCHVPSMKTRPEHPMAQLRDVDAPIYSDLLLHEMGQLLADGLRDESAGPGEWRTAPLMGLRHQRTFMHDGRSTTILDAIEAHQGPASQANVSVEAFHALTQEERAALVRFVESL